MNQERRTPNPNTKTNLLLIFILVVLLAGLVVTLFLLRQPQIFKKFAAEQGLCSWTCQNECPDTFSVKITDLTTQEIIFDDFVKGNSINFNTVLGHTYNCSVSAQNRCGVGEGSDTRVCAAIETPTPTLPTITTSPSPSLTPTLTPTLTLTPPLTPPTATPTNTPAATTTPTLPPTVTPTVTPTPTTPVTHQGCRYGQCLVLPGPPAADEQTCATYLDCLEPTGSPTLSPMVTTTLTPAISPTATPTLLPGVTPTKTPIPTATPTPLAEALPESGISWPTYVILATSFLMITSGLLILKAL